MAKIGFERAIDTLATKLSRTVYLGPEWFKGATCGTGKVQNVKHPRSFREDDKLLATQREYKGY